MGMVVMILEKTPANVRGELTRWMIEVKSGIFVGHLSARVRDKLWEKCLSTPQIGGVIQIWNTNTEQHFQMRMSGHTEREIIELEGLQLIRIPQRGSVKTEK